MQSFLIQHHAVLKEISEAMSNVFEGLCLVYVAQCYEKILGYQVAVEGAKNGAFRFKCSTSGRPYNFSYFVVRKGAVEYEIRHNLALSGCRDQDIIYFLDIAVIKKDSICSKLSIRKGSRHTLDYCPNKDLISFAECKHLVAYSMLIAYFLGIVFELKPKNLQRGSFERLSGQFSEHIFPSLLISGTTHIGAETAISSIKNRKYAVTIAADLFKSPESLFSEVRHRVKPESKAT